MPTDPNAPRVFAQRDLVQWFMRFDNDKLRPFLIRNYSRARAQKEDEYAEAIMENFEVNNVEEIQERLNSVFVMGRNASYINIPRAKT